MARARPGYGVPNRFKVPKKFWRRLPPIGRTVFNETFEAMRDNQAVFLPSGHTLSRSARLWRITCWNAAWVAADATRSKQRRG
jgi:hypothetical protein